MLYGKAVFSVLIVSGSQKGTDFVTEILDSNIFTPISCAKGGAEARRMMSECEYDIVGDNKYSLNRRIRSRTRASRCGKGKRNNTSRSRTKFSTKYALALRTAVC